MENNNELPQIENVDETETKRMMADFRGEKLGWVTVGEKKCFVPAKYVKQCSVYYNFEAKPDDTWVVTYPRSGTTWTQELVWLLSNDLDYKTATSVPLVMRYPFLELSMAVPDSTIESIRKEHRNNAEIEAIVSNVDSSYEVARTMPSPRFIKTHFLLSLVPNILKSKCKVVYVARNPKDVAVSYYHFHQSAKAYDYCGDFERFWNYFQNDQVSFSPYWKHIKEGWLHRHEPNFLFLFYEEMTHDLLTATKKVANFLGKSYTEEQYEKLVNHLTFHNLQNNKMVNLTRDKAKVIFKKDTFMRQGKSQAWHSMFSPTLNEQANNWIRENLKDTDIEFPFIDIYS
ncbi:sulfotransferase 1 family member D1-like [Phymastichus coffea]|uniref:sulfotransferase 1 family member D1-like n=1 Tax=Phymastichus coffea TaxID=108790 RepID=UPI00273C8ED9|nr:sulfotransferase 1 family member D1-like [Phymastichus coffea]